MITAILIVCAMAIIAVAGYKFIKAMLKIIDLN